MKKRKNENKLTSYNRNGLPDNFKLNNEFLEAFEILENTKKHIFITGKAGTGKSTLLKFCKLNTAKKTVVLASTGIAALNVGGLTIHSFFRFPPKLIKKDVIRRIRNSNTIKQIDTIIIDEVSMVRADLMDGIDYSLRINRENMKIPFGGVQMVFFGDLFQLPPVVEKDVKEYLNENYDSPYFFGSKVFKETKIKYIELNKIFRQKDKKFIDLLNRIRNKNEIGKALTLLNDRVDCRKTEINRHWVILTTTNSKASDINNEKLSKLSGKEYNYEAKIVGELDEKAYPTERSLKLKKDAQIILIMNDPQRRWMNGTISQIAGLSRDSIQISIDDYTYEVPKVTWEKIAYKYNAEKKEIEEKTIGTFEQYPLRLAWAITIHRSQGQTFNNVFIDIGHGAFTHGQVYVALSRCTSLEGIILKKPISESDIIFDKRIYEFRDKYLEI